jgi:tetratricopeptide (TPR) repeat protein
MPHRKPEARATLDALQKFASFFNLSRATDRCFSMAKELIEDLHQQIDTRQVVVIVGTGVSIGATNGNALASWTGLLHSGVDRCVEVAQPLPKGWAERANAEIDSGDLDDLLSAAEKISSKLGAPAGGEYRRWLRETVGSLHAQQREVLEALRDLGLVLATTNYDGLIEEVTGLEAVTWMDGAQVERVVRGDDKGVLHLHGFWKKPESVVLGIRSYEKVLTEAHAQTVLRALQTMKTLIFVGCGEGLNDPNFGALLEWTGKVFAQSEYRRFRLALDGEVETLQRQHPKEQRIFVVGYGAKHGDLAGFLRGLRPRREAHPATPAAAAPPASAAALPPAPRCFGREREVADLVNTLLANNPPPAPILGPAGIGKSTITLAALHDTKVAGRFGARRFFIRCDAVQTREALVAEIARVLGMQIAPNIEPAVLTALASGPVALAIDNTETPWEADTLRVEELLAMLAAVPRLALIASVRGAQRPLGVPWREPIQPPILPLVESRKVFLAIAGSGFENDPHLVELLSALDGVPLAITLLACAAEGEPNLDGIWTRWQRERTEMLQRAEGADRLSNIEISYQFSITGRRMTGEARRFLALLATLPDGVAAGDIEAIFPVHGGKAASILRKTGLAFDEAGRLRLLAPLREYVGRKYPPEPDGLAHVVDRYLKLASEKGMLAGREGGAEAVAQLAAEVGNIEAMISKGLERADPRPAIGAAIALGQFARFTGFSSAKPLEQAAAAARRASRTQDEADCVLSLGDIALARSDHDTARARFEEALRLFRRAGNVVGEANCISNLGEIALHRSDHDTARARFEEALPLFRRVGAVLGEANCIQALGDIALDRSDHDTARTRFEEARPLYRRVGAVLGEANCIQSLGDIALARPNHDAAHARFEEALTLFRRVGAVHGEASCIVRLGDIALARSDRDAARARFEEALPLFRRVGNVLGEANCIRSLGDIALDRSDHDTARVRFEEALSLYKRIPEPYSIGWTHRRLARIARDEPERRRHVLAARAAWESIKRQDLLDALKNEFGDLA